MKTLIIGGSGFIGTNLINLLLPSTDVINLDKSPSEKYPSITKIVDIRDKVKLEKYIPDDVTSVIILAAEHRDDVTPISLYYDVNVEGTRNILEVLTRKNIHNVIFTSSVAVYGLGMDNPDEDTPVNPFNHYGISKWQAEQLLVEWQNETNNHSLVIVRPTVVFGPGNKGNVYNLLSQIVSGRFLMVGKGTNKKSMAYVDNISLFLQYCLSNTVNGYRLFNYVDTPDLSVNELLNLVEQKLGKKIASVRLPYAVGYCAGKCLDLMAKVTGKKYPISSVRIKKFCATTQFSGDKMQHSGFKPKVTLQEGINRTLQSICENQEEVTGKIKVLNTVSYKLKEAD